MSNTEDSVKSRLVEVSDTLQIPSDTLQITLVRLDQLRNEPDVDASNLDDTAAAALALSSREDGLPVTENDIAEAWSESVDSQDRDITISHQQLEAVSSYIDMEEVPAHPKALVESLGDAVEMPEELIAVARRLLQDAFEADPTVVAGGPSPAATAGAVLSLAARINGVGDDYGQDILGQTSGTSEVTVRNRSQDLTALLGEDRLQDERYQVETESEDQAATASDDGEDQPAAESSADDQSTAADGAGTAESDSSDSGGFETDLTVEAVESEIDDLVDDLGVGASARLLARGMVSDAVSEVDDGDPAELAGAMTVAASRMEDGDADIIEVADRRSFQPRVISQWLDTLDDAVGIDIPRRDADEIIELLVDQLDLGEEVRQESLTALQRYDMDEAATEYTAGELGSGAVLFAATVGRAQVDVEDLSAIGGAGPEYINSAMNSIVVSLCLGLVRGDIDYDECAWTTDLLESELSPNIGDAYTGRVIAIAQTYTAGREGLHVDDSTLNVVFADD